MSQMLDDIAYLSQEIGPRPAGTEEEHQAAEYIAERFEKGAGLRASIEEFSCCSQPGLLNAILFGLAAVVSILGIFINAVRVPALIVSLLCLALFALEVFNIPVLSRVMNRGVSQNVIARYKPETQNARGRRRKVILVANYDSDKMRAELSSGLMGVFPLAQKASWVGLAALPVLWVIRILAPAAGVFFGILIAIASICAAIQLALFVIHRTAAYNEAANNNAAGVATLIEIARIANFGRQVDQGEESAAGVQIEGEEAAREAGVIPEGASVSYELGDNAIADQATGAMRPVQVATNDIADELAQVGYVAEDQLTDDDVALMREETKAIFTGEAPLPAAPAPVQDEEDASAEDAEGQEEAEQPKEDNIPDWFKSAQAKAKSSDRKGKPIRRSRYADALDAAVKESSVHFEEANKVIHQEAESRDALRAASSIVEVAAPAQGEENDAEATLERAARARADLRARAEARLAARQRAHEQDEQNDIALQEALREEETAAVVEQIDGAGQAEAAQPVARRDEADAGSTTAMEPIDVSSLRAQVSQNDDSDPRVARLQARPSRDIQHAERVSNDRVVYDETQNEELVDFSQIPEPKSVEQAPVRRRPSVHQETVTPRVTLPEVLPTDAPALPSLDELKQHAPLADATEAPVRTSGNPELSARIPRIDVGGDDNMADNKRAALRNTLPSLSGTISAVKQPEPEEERHSTVSVAGSFAASGATSAFNPVGDELVADVDPNELYIDDVDDSAYDSDATATGAWAGPGYMEMPSKKGFFGRLFGKKKRYEVAPSASEWIGVDENFNPTEVGAARGGWESFQEGSDYERAQQASQGSYDDYAYDDYYDEDEYDDNPGTTQRWNGGAFSRARAAAEQLGSRGAAEEEDMVEERPRFRAQPLSAEFSEVAGLAAAMSGDSGRIPTQSEEMQEIYEFQDDGLNVEVWFVALGSEYSGNGGMKAFVQAHEKDLRGSVIVNVEALGAGKLSMVLSEGEVRTKKASSRMKHCARSANQATGMKIAETSIDWRESAASVAMANGLQGVTIAGMDDKKPAFMGQGDDVWETISEEKLQQNAEYVLNFIKNI
ncbi:hypothetical protein AAY81_09925 [Denitrobacterium detoxificans]|uniref:Peptidase family M28 n=1 Tax=Denitrobacterium detoxificans TaxID=79604 RepID=A0A172S068_9ACTN|nr:hypothetical protein [Denitrobacterium detoxificans]ANE23356.1 hypothetical protein AAY81_09925 [Denitrobacterium detoxificans]SEO41584.1 hypothetical protein SAMN02910314_00182 [Denitrobacterium detoxificans]